MRAMGFPCHAWRSQDPLGRSPNSNHICKETRNQELRLWELRILSALATDVWCGLPHTCFRGDMQGRAPQVWVTAPDPGWPGPETAHLRSSACCLPHLCPCSEAQWSGSHTAHPDFWSPLLLKIGKLGSKQFYCVESRILRNVWSLFQLITVILKT